MVKNSNNKNQFKKHQCFQYCMNKVLERVDREVRVWKEESEVSTHKKVPDKKFLILSTPRTGSTALCNNLTKNGFGDVREYFNGLVLNKYIESLDGTPIKFENYLRVAFNHGLNHEKIFGVNVLINQFISLIARKINILGLKYDKIYLLERRNKLKQAYSLMKSEKTFIYTSDILDLAQMKYGEIEVEADEVHFSLCLNKILSEEAYIKKCLTGFPYKIIFFEDIISDKFESCVNSIKEDLDFPLDKYEALPPSIMSTNADNFIYKEILRKIGAQH